MKNVKTPFCTLVFTTFCTLWRRHVLKMEEVPGNPETKPTAKKTPNRAGATPLFGFQPPKKFRGVAPARFVSYTKPHDEP